MMEFRSKFHWNLFPGVQLTISQHSPNRRQDIAWTNDDPVYRRIYAVLGGDGLIHSSNNNLSQWWLVVNNNPRKKIGQTWRKVNKILLKKLHSKMASAKCRPYLQALKCPRYWQATKKDAEASEVYSPKRKYVLMMIVMMMMMMMMITTTTMVSMFLSRQISCMLSLHINPWCTSSGGQMGHKVCNTKWLRVMSNDYAYAYLPIRMPISLRINKLTNHSTS